MLLPVRWIVVPLLAAGLSATTARAQSANAPTWNRDSTAQTYCAAWRTTDRPERDRLLERSFDANGSYSDPQTHAASRAALSDSIAAVLGRTPGARITCSKLQMHDDVMRMTWVVVDATGKEILRGMDFGEFASDGRIRRIIGFFGAPPSVSPR